MPKLKVTSWNIAHLDRLVKPNLNPERIRRDVLYTLEGPKGEKAIAKDLKGNPAPFLVPHPTSTKPKWQKLGGQQTLSLR